MKGLDRLTVCRKVACLAALVMLVVAATPLPATESEVKAEPTKTEEAKAEETAEVSQAQTVEESDAAICIDADAGQATGVRTLEDIYSLSGGNLAALLQLTAEPADETTPAGEEVRWTAVEKNDEPRTGTQADPTQVN